jgi:hypothetical protein
MEADPPTGLIFHTAGFSGTGLFRIFDVWESEEDRAPPSVQYTYELHDVIPRSVSPNLIGDSLVSDHLPELLDPIDEDEVERLAEVAREMRS